MRRVFTTSTFARRLGFRNANDSKFRQLLKLAERKGLIKIQQSGFRSDSIHHPKLVVVENLKLFQNYFNILKQPDKKSEIRAYWCPYCASIIEDFSTKKDFDSEHFSGQLIECPYCFKEFIVGVSKKTFKERGQVECAHKWSVCRVLKIIELKRGPAEVLQLKCDLCGEEGRALRWLQSKELVGKVIALKSYHALRD